MNTWALWLALLVGVLTLQYLKHLWHQRSYPPGPFPFPFIGSLWKTGFRIYPDTFIKMRKQYGNVYTIWIGSIPVVLLSGFQIVKETIIRRSGDFADRPKSHLVSAALKEKVSGISYGNGHPWKQQRQFITHCLRKLGVGGQGLLLHIETQANHLIELFEREKGQPFDPSWPIINSVSNVLCSLVFGHVLEDENFQQLIETIDYIFKFGGSSFHLLYEAFPWLMRYLPGPHKKALNFIEMVFFFSKKKMEEHKEQLMLQEPQGFIDFYLLHMEKVKNKPDSTFDEESLANNIMELFVAGTNTTSTAVQWALLLLASHPDIQEKAHKEIEDALGSSAIITYHDRKKVPYTNAVIHEMQRFRYGLLASMPRQTTKDVTLDSCIIPKGSIVVPDLRSVLFDPDQWETPVEFNPNHFLDKDGQFVDREEFLPFSAGARVCPGELLARTELFIFVTSLLRVFRLQLPKGVQEPNLEPCPGFVTQPYPYKICAVPYSNAS